MNNGNRILFTYPCFSDSFLHTTFADVTLTSPTFLFNNTICIQLLLGLCATCEMYISLYDETGITELKNFLIKSSSKGASHDLPTWQSVTIKYSTNSYDIAKIKLTSKLNSYSSNPLWAVANLRHCSSTNFNILTFQYVSLNLLI